MNMNTFLSVRMSAKDKELAIAKANSRGEILSDIVRDFIKKYTLGQNIPSIKIVKNQDVTEIDARSAEKPPKLTETVSASPIKHGRPSDDLLRAMGSKKDPEPADEDLAFWDE